MLHLFRVVPAFAATALCNGSGLILWALLSAFGLSAIFATSPFAYDALRIVGAIFLVGLAIQTLYTLRKESGKFAVAFIPQFVPSGIPVGTGIAALGVVQAVTSTSWYMTLVVMVDRASRLLARPPVRRGLTAVSAVGILVLATGLLLASRR